MQLHDHIVLAHFFGAGRNVEINVVSFGRVIPVISIEPFQANTKIYRSEVRFLR